MPFLKPMKKHTLPELNFTYDALEPFLDKETVEIHHDKHHAGYVAGANTAEEALENARKNGDFSKIKAIGKELAFHVSGHVLHSLFWHNLSPANESGKPSDELMKKIIEVFDSFEIFKKEFSAAATQVEGSGWAALALRKIDQSLVVIQIEKHQDLVQQGCAILMVCDVWEHAYYLKYQNRRAEWIEAFWNIVNWDKVSKRFASASHCQTNVFNH